MSSVKGKSGPTSRSVAGLLCIALVALAPGCTGKGSRQLEQKGRVNDYAQVLSAKTSAALTAELDRYQKETCHNVAVLIVPTLKGESITDFSTRTALAWKIVDPVLRDGILLTIAIEEGQARFEMGTALQDIIDQGAAERIMRSEMVPSFREKDFDTGVARGLRAIMEEARSLVIPEELRPSTCRNG